MGQLKLSSSKCSVLQLGKICVNYSYAINDVILPLVKNMFDLEITVDYNLDFKLYVNTICFKAKQRPSLILWCFYTCDKYILIRAFTTRVWPLVEYCCSVWSQYVRSLVEYCCPVWSPYVRPLVEYCCSVWSPYVRPLAEYCCSVWSPYVRPLAEYCCSVWSLYVRPLVDYCCSVWSPYVRPLVECCCSVWSPYQ